MAESGSSHDIDAGSVIGFVFAQENAGFSRELAANFADNGTCGYTHSVHGAGCEYERK
jgi:hypothetical protein